MAILTMSAIACALPAWTQTDDRSANRIQFFCAPGYDDELKQSIPTTFAGGQENRKTAIVRWRSDWFKRDSGDPNTRCEEVSARFQQAYQLGMLAYLTHGRMSGKPVICATRNYGGACQQLILTLKAEDDPNEVLNQLNSILQGGASTVLNQSTGDSQVYIRFDVEAFVNQAVSGK